MMRRLRRSVAALSMALAAATAAAQPAASTAPGQAVSAPTPATSAPTPALPAGAHEQQLLRSERFRQLASELRCLVCQNQTLADSNADLAIDLRDEVLRLMAAGHTDQQIKRHLVDRYGDFVLYRPTFAARNWVLWAGPFVMMAIGALVLWRVSRRRPVTGSRAALSGDDAERIRRLLGDDPPR